MPEEELTGAEEERFLFKKRRTPLLYHFPEEVLGKEIDDERFLFKKMRPIPVLYETAPGKIIQRLAPEENFVEEKATTKK